VGSLDGRCAVVTGAGSGIGRAVAIRLADEGATVLAVDCSGQETVTAKLGGKRLLAHHADVSSSAEVQRIAERVAAEMGGLRVLVNSAGIGGIGSVLDTDENLFDRVLAVNVRGAYLCMKYCIPLIAAGGGGSVVNVASIASMVAQPGIFSYAASKGALLMATRAAALDVASMGVRVNAVCPGTIDTPLLGEVSEATASRLREAHPIGRTGRPEEVAAMTLWLASDQSSFSTGAAFVVDGGRTAGLSAY